MLVRRRSVRGAELFAYVCDRARVRHGAQISAPCSHGSALRTKMCVASGRVYTLRVVIFLACSHNHLENILVLSPPAHLT